MATTLPTRTAEIDTQFMSTWYEIRAEAIDNILDAIVVWAALKESGCFKTQVGGEWITRSILHGKTTAEGVAKGDLLTQGEPELKTMAMWPWRHLATHVQRSAIDDQKNNGPSKIADLVADRLTSARKGLQDQYEDDCLRAQDGTESAHKYMQSLWDLLPEYDTNLYGNGGGAQTYGGINLPTAYADSGNGVMKPSTGNTWWGGNYMEIVAPMEVNLVTNMKTLFNSISNNQEAPNLIVADQTLFELYEDFGLDASQIIKEDGTQLMDLGFEVLKFKGKRMIWTPDMYDSTYSHSRMMFLNTDYIDVVYDPNLWFDMTEFKPIPLQLERIAHIVCACNLVGSQPRRNGLLTEDLEQ